MDFMEIALEEASKSLIGGDVPIGAVIVRENKIIAKAHNMKELEKDATKHAEMIAIQEASKAICDWRLNGCEMYVTLEPCVMCMGAILHSRISKLHIGAFNVDMGCCGSVINLADDRRLGSFINVIWEYDDRCSKLLNEFFRAKRNK